VSSARALPLAGLPRPAQWGLLVLISAVAALGLQAAHLPAALMLGPMIAGMMMEAGGGSVRIPNIFIDFAQAIIGCLIARSITKDSVSEFGHQWFLFLGAASIVVVAAGALGYTISRFGVIRGTTAVWGILPGAAPAMILMAEEFGADSRLVAFMQYLRVAFVAVTASTVGRFWMKSGPGSASHAIVWFPPVHAAAFVFTLAIIAISFVVGLRLKLPAGVLILSMTLGSIAHVAGWSTIELPTWFLAMAYAVIGWSTGLRFSRDVFKAAARALPQTILAIVILIGFCAGLAALVVKTSGTDPLTAYLATSPGGVDSVAIIAASTKVDTSFVMALQSVRFLLVLAAGPPLSRFVARLVTAAERKTPQTGSELRKSESAARRDTGDLD
jgi:membrane AbrB-like protein